MTASLIGSPRHFSVFYLISVIKSARILRRALENTTRSLYFLFAFFCGGGGVCRFVLFWFLFVVGFFVFLCVRVFVFWGVFLFFNGISIYVGNFNAIAIFVENPIAGGIKMFIHFQRELVRK